MIAPDVPPEDRVDPPCRHHGTCGGCALQHASDTFVARWREQVVRQALAGQGLETRFLPAVTVPALSRRRVVFSGRRTKKSVILGFHGRASHVLTDITDCRLIVPGLLALRPLLTELTRLGASRSAELRFQAEWVDDGADLAVSGAKALDRPGTEAAVALAIAAGLVRLSWNGEILAALRPVTRRFGRALVALPPGGFAQPSDAGETALLDGVRQAIGGAARIADLFCGAGTFALPLAEKAEVLAWDGDAGAVAALDKAWRHAAGLHRVTALCRDLFRNPVRAAELAGIAAVVIDPPRAGAEAQATELARSGAERLAYVSCNPLTFARDARLLTAGGWRLDHLRVIDQFRWSTHVELVAAFFRP